MYSQCIGLDLILALAKTILFLMLFLLMDVIIPFRILLGTVSIIRLRNLRLPA
ncbi:hypothetical protein COLAER_02308 [Collinsella aerofaciens ATCC 25986]|uniref:Uncharacterized protein n=1 Tax=Collinsella aerofaciens (strain ATCC 25986 / DSM 3979 / JCM 10188 / KCTC 3647 / NCTC 11838 / VPI 1003) TaxID=411903 RepID=A4ECW8_COLAA|nr:hypothetical protein COLAER_02308 [Collinsella aerofaciens ATCC 25986]